MLFKFVRNMFLPLVGFCLVLLMNVVSMAESNAAANLKGETNLAEDGQLGSLSEEQECKIKWEALWKLAKMGDIDAISALFFYNFPTAAHSPIIYMPGLEDQLSRRRNIIILAVYSAEVASRKKTYSERYKELSRVAYDAYLNDGREGTEFLKCLSKKEQEECVGQVKGSLVPSFDKYAAEIDALMAQGMQPECHLRGE